MNSTSLVGRSILVVEAEPLISLDIVHAFERSGAQVTAISKLSVACLPDVIPGPKCKSGYFRSLSRRFGHGTEGEVDGGDHRLLA